ncbi:MAG: hypothetical protein ACRBB6_07580 [Neptuniibacter sp.]
MRNRKAISNLVSFSRDDIPECMKEIDIYISANGERRGIELNDLYNEHKKDSAERISIQCDDVLKDQVSKALRKHNSEEELRIGVDISLIHRKALSELFALLLYGSRSISIHVFYSLARYAPPNTETFPNERVESVGIPFTGWSTKPGLPVTAIVGLGYEKNKALGAIEYLEASNSVLLLPNSSEESYKGDIIEQNDTLLSFTPEELQVNYDVQTPVDTIYLLDSLISGYKHGTKVVLLPFGPKIFFACSLIAAIANPEVSVWHVSSVDHQNSLNQDREVADIFGFSCLVSAL